MQLHTKSAPDLDGLRWILRGSRTFLKRPWVLTGFMLLYWAVLLGVGWLCFLSVPNYLSWLVVVAAFQMLLPFCAAGLLLVFRRTDEGVSSGFGDLRAGFGNSRVVLVSLVKLGLINTAFGVTGTLLVVGTDSGFVWVFKIFSAFVDLLMVLAAGLVCRYGVGPVKAVSLALRAMVESGVALGLFLLVLVPVLLGTSWVQIALTNIVIPLWVSVFGSFLLIVAIVIPAVLLAPVLTIFAASVHHMFESLFQEGDPIQAPATP